MEELKNNLKKSFTLPLPGVAGRKTNLPFSFYYRTTSKGGRGVTLIETLVYITVLVIIVATIFLFLIWLVHSNIKTKVMRETLDNARRSMEKIIYEIKEAKSIYSPTTTSSQLSLEIIKYLPENEEDTYIDFYLCGTQLCLKKESQNPIALTSDAVEVKSLVFTKIISGLFLSVHIDLTVDYKNPEGLPEYDASVRLTSTASLRSY